MFRIKTVLNLRHLASHKILSNSSTRKLSDLKKQSRKWGKDEILTVGTWLLVGTGAFVLIGTTTSASVALLLANSLQFQGKTKSLKKYK